MDCQINEVSPEQKESEGGHVKEFLPPKDDCSPTPFDKIKLEEKITLAIQHEDFSSALGYLEKVSELQTDPNRKMYSLLQKIACQDKMEIHYNTSGSLHELLRLMIEQKVSPEAARLEAGQYFTEKSFTKGFALYYCACKLFVTCSDAKVAMEEITTCFTKIEDQLVPLVVADEFKRKYLSSFMIPALNEVAEDLKDIKGASPVDLAKAGAWCGLRIASFYQQCGEDGTVIKVLKKAVSALEGGPWCEVFGICLNNIGTAYSRLGHVDDASKYYNDAISVYYKADDLSNDEKNLRVDQVKKNQDLLKK